MDIEEEEMRWGVKCNGRGEERLLVIILRESYNFKKNIGKAWLNELKPFGAIK